jgi:hypothetical protein
VAGKFKRKRIKRETIQHYERMIEWAGERSKDIVANLLIMCSELGESWEGFYCSYCNFYNVNGKDCWLCPLGNYTSCCDGLWSRMNEYNITWEEWIIRAKKVLEYIKKHG